jgi:hypothetical protein
MDLLLRAPENLVMELDARVDKDRFKNRTHLILVILADWLAREIHPVSPYSSALSDLEDEEAWVSRDRVATKRALLGEEWDKYKNSGGDMLDGEWASQRIFEQMEAESQAIEQRARLKAELCNEIRNDLKAELLAELRDELGGRQVITDEKVKQGRAKAKPKGKKK